MRTSQTNELPWQSKQSIPNINVNVSALNRHRTIRWYDGKHGPRENY